ncbi:MAG TPA: hypothetical protein VH333_22675 [Pseudonocardiaceae bacterium]|jgi:hypothetical protein|nr:hypothetical protein [Pseudonocardiaceae bacterium]
MQDNDDYDVDRALDDDTEAGAAGEVGRRRRFNVGSRATILMGLTMGVMAAAAFMPGHESFTISIV